MKQLDPRNGGRRKDDSSLVGEAKIIRFSTTRAPFGWIRTCLSCGQRFQFPYHAATTRDGRQSVCAPCWLRLRP